MIRIAAFLRRDLQIFWSYRAAALVQVAGILFQLLVFFALSETVATAAVGPTGRYFDFVAIGIALVGFVSASLSGFSSKIREAQVSGTLEALLVTPTPPWLLIAGSTAGDYAIAAVRFGATLALSALLFDMPFFLSGLPAALVVVALTVAIFTGIGLASSAVVMVFKRGDPIAQGVTYFAILFGGVYFPTKDLGSGAEPLLSIIPVAPALDALRRLLLAGEPAAAVAGDLRSLAIMAALLLPAGALAFAWGLRRARRDGSLTHF